MATTLTSITSAQSLAHRSRIATLISSLRPIRFRTPVCNLQAHRIPTLWSLYRGLLRDAPSDAVRSRIRAVFQREKGIRKASTVKELLQKHHKMRDTFAAAKAGEARAQAIVQRYARFVAFRRAWRKRLANRSILTGAYREATLFHGPLPEMKPFPMHVSRLIAKRKRNRESRIVRVTANREVQMDIKREAEFERALARWAEHEGVPFEGVFMGYEGSWLEPLVNHEQDMQAALTRDEERAKRPFPPALVAQIKGARREKIANKTRELQRERAGLVIKRTILRRAAGPPAHVLAKMTEAQRRMDRVSRSVSEVGYVAIVKKRLGWKLRDPEAWKVEMGKQENLARLEREAMALSAENVRRRSAAGEPSN
ncbi:hypothetical protein FOMPIDRAFT_43521 [Fomitopsis schrenkii]|uniref:Uncharacterized protein n=1 Tax=Fomitopsis schrenkii TaxID=2126942 RepID=S8FGE6_FOMSC|nr:hypothetical protein FOMPIDRAFT_43521 [Fomitopsis schrenkii]